MDDRYSYDNEGPTPCGICGGQVREHMVKGTMSLADITPPMEVRRTCLNRTCDSNTGSMTLADVV